MATLRALGRPELVVPLLLLGGSSIFLPQLPTVYQEESIELVIQVAWQVVESWSARSAGDEPRVHLYRAGA